jgi:uncharacterized Zn finger protein
MPSWIRSISRVDFAGAKSTLNHGSEITDQKLQIKEQELLLMPNFTRNWWGDRFIETLEQSTDGGRLGRGRSYARGGKVKSFTINNGTIKAQVRGSVNPYFGVYKEPLYTITIDITPISQTKWADAIAFIASKAGYISKLLLNEIPDTIEDAFTPLGLHLLPQGKDLKTNCSCPDWSNPCKHIAGVYYLVAAELDRDPFLLFELRGLSKAVLQSELSKSQLGMALSAELSTQKPEPVPANSFYSSVEAIAPDPALSLKAFWHGTKRLPSEIEVEQTANVPAIVVKKQGDFPPFWHKDQSFIAVMEEVYKQVRSKNRDVF